MCSGLYGNVYMIEYAKGCNYGSQKSGDKRP